MSIYQHYLETATDLIQGYKADYPFHLYLKHFFSNHRKYGSRDRKLITSLCFNYFRLGHAFRTMPVRERIVAAYFVINAEASGFLEAVDSSLNEHSALSTPHKLKLLDVSSQAGDIFPFPWLLSEKLNAENYSNSMLQQPDVFLRARPKLEKKVEEMLSSLGWKYTRESHNCFRVESGLPVEKHFQLNKQLVVQDLNSQRIGALLKDVFLKHQFNPKQVWDCCAASGGKSIMLHDVFNGISITVSDIRQSILKNLETRFREAGIAARQQFIADLAIKGIKLPIKPFEFILADVPCSGSGTWARNPEQLYYFKEAIIGEYATKQKAIVLNALSYLNPGGWFAYVTCSVFKKENEEMVDLLLKDEQIALIHSELLDGTKQKSDSMFIAIFRRKI